MTNRETCGDGWQIDDIEVLDHGVRVSFVGAAGQQREYVTPEFGVRSRAASAALARFAAQHGLGTVNRLYRHFRALPADYRGAVFPRRFDRGVSRLAGIQ